MPHADFVHLHLHTEYSLLDGVVRLQELVALAHQYQLPALAITDHGNMFGVIDFYKQVNKAGIKPIIGSEMYIAPNSRLDKKSTGGISDASFHLTVLAKNLQGYKNLMKLSTVGYLEGFYYKPRIDKEILMENHQGLVILSGCPKGEVAHLIGQGKLEEAKKVISWYKELFEEDYYLEIQEHHLPEEVTLNRELVNLSKLLNIPLVATNDVHYLKREDAKPQDILLCIQTGNTVEEKSRLRFSGDEFYFRSPSEMKQLFAEIEEAVTRTVEVAEKCNLLLELGSGKVHLPHFPLPAGYESTDEYLEYLAKTGLARRYSKITPSIEERLSKELSIIKKMGYAGYFLIVKDFIDVAYKKQIPVGPGRGSAVGSLVLYALGITEVDPLQYGLIFERFLNLERISLPDIDIDFGDKRRGEIIDYVLNKYGAENVTQIITFGTMLAKQAIRDVVRALNLSYQDGDRLAKLIPFGVSIEKAIETTSELKELINSNPRYREVVEIAQKLEGIIRHASTHAAGIVITPGPLIEYLPLFKGTKGEVSTQYEMKCLEDIGLLKMDFLGLRTLTVIEETFSMLQEKGIIIDIKNISFEDKKTFKLLRQGETIGVFQLESSGMRDLLRQVQPDTIHDIIAIISLYRPGPMGRLNDYIQRKHGRAPIVYDHPLLEKILKETYGVITYQEQVIEIASVLAGFSLGEADVLRAAMSKKRFEVMSKKEQDFVRGAKENGVSEKSARKIFNEMATFAGYGFNKSHAAGYAYLAYQTVFLKAHYPVEFMAASLSSEMGNSERILTLTNECRRMGITLLSPDINQSDYRFKVINDKILFGLGAIKNVGENAIISIQKARDRSTTNFNKVGTDWSSLANFLGEVDTRLVNKKVVESLIKAGAFDSLNITGTEKGYYRAMLFASVNTLLERAACAHRLKEKKQTSIFGQTAVEKMTFDVSPVSAWSKNQILSYEKEVLGFYLSGHPLDAYQFDLESFASEKISNLTELEDRKSITIGGVITAVKPHHDRSGKEMSFLSLEDFTGSTEVVVFSDLYAQYRQKLQPESIFLIKGTISTKEGEKPKIIASDLLPLSEAKETLAHKLEISLFLEELDGQIGIALKSLFAGFPGKCQVFVRLQGTDGNKTTLRLKGVRVDPTEEFIQKTKKLVGDGRLRLVGHWVEKRRRRNGRNGEWGNRRKSK
ncbi:MAG: DNA polymerase III subunit alpha [Candidatus Edwardsbacteria bacterium]